jgi:ELWxxDGT repeat protein
LRFISFIVSFREAEEMARPEEAQETPRRSGRRRGYQTTLNGGGVRPRRLRCERLEDRRLLAVDFELLKDINLFPAGSNISPMVDVGGVAFFTAETASHGAELWRSDGTPAGTFMVNDIRVGSLGSGAGHLVNVNGTLFFRANDGVIGYELWKSDGSAAGTARVKEILPGPRGAMEGFRTSIHERRPQYLENVNGTLFFVARDESSGEELWKSDGTEAGTVRVKDIAPGLEWSDPENLTNVGGTLFFEASTADGNALWKSDGTEQGTVLIKDIAPGIFRAGMHQFTNVGGVLYFQGNDNIHGYELWKSDGTEQGTVIVRDIYPGNQFALMPEALTDVNGTLFFRRDRFLWKSDGTSLGTQPVQFFDFISDLVNLNGVLYFFGSESPTSRDGLWKSDGTQAGTNRIADVTFLGSNELVNVGGMLYFSSNGLWKSDGTAVGTVRIGNFSQVNQLANIGGTLFFSAHAAGAGHELWKSDGTEADTVLVDDLRAGTGDSAPAEVVNVNGTLFFAASDSAAGRELWKSDGTPAGTVRVKDILLATVSSNPAYLTEVNGMLFFTAFTLTHGVELWKSDGTEAGTLIVKDIRPGSLPFRDETFPQIPADLINVSGTLYFRASDGKTGNELWRSDGTEAGTFRVKDIRPGSAGFLGAGRMEDDRPFFTNVGGTLFFRANDGVHGAELWKSDGTEAGTVLVKDMTVGPGGTFSASQPFFENVNGTLFFQGWDAIHGRELWKSDGSDSGTVLVENISQFGSSEPTALTNVGGTLYFLADGGDGRELWRSDGTIAGTALVKDIRAANSSSLANYLTNVGGTLFFRADDGISGIELWKSDGTEAGTIQVKDIRPGSGGSSPDVLTSINGRLYFRANDGIHGDEWWESDGTEAGTTMLEDIAGDSGGGAGRFIAEAGGKLFAVARTDAFGEELWVADFPGALPVAGDFNDDGVVDGSDLLFWQMNAGKWANPPGSGADGNGDGVVDAADLDLWRSRMGALPRRSGSAATFRPGGRAEYDFVGTPSSTIDAVLTDDLFAPPGGRPVRGGYVAEKREPFVFRPARRATEFGVPTVSEARAEAPAAQFALPEEDSELLVLRDELFASWNR